MLFDHEMQLPSSLLPIQARHAPCASFCGPAVGVVRAATAGPAAAARTSAPTTTVRRTRLVAGAGEGFEVRAISGPFNVKQDSANTLTRERESCGHVIAAGLFQQAPAVRLHRHQVTEQRVVLIALLDR